ncbi:MAG: class I SAM-dependent methyltransferase [Myxococcales bacterium]|nr:class I SAM-dependent methyltransferase [Myxococcales bacterium]
MRDKQADPAAFFDKKTATTFDDIWAPLAPLKQALHLLMRFVLAELPEQARVLCVGAGTGAELLYLAGEFPGWHFTAVEPAAPMLEVCRARVREAGLLERCELHQGYLDSLGERAPFDAATSLLVSQFLPDREQRVGFFSAMRARLRSGGLLVSADLSSDMASAEYRALIEIWRRALRFCHVPEERLAHIDEAYGKSVAVLPRAEVAALIEAAGFSAPTVFLQTGLIHAWFAEA